MKDYHKRQLSSSPEPEMSFVRDQYMCTILIHIMLCYSCGWAKAWQLRRSFTLLLLLVVIMLPQLPLFLHQARLLLPFYCFTCHYHHQRLIPLLFAIGRATLIVFPPFALAGTELLSSFPAFLDGSHTFFVCCFGFLSWA